MFIATFSITLYLMHILKLTTYFKIISHTTPRSAEKHNRLESQNCQESPQNIWSVIMVLSNNNGNEVSCFKRQSRNYNKELYLQ